MGSADESWADRTWCRRCCAIRICLFAHRAADPQPTGVGRYLRELAHSLPNAIGDTDSIVLASTPEPGRADWVPARIESRVVPWPRRVVQTAWCLGTGPRLERSLGRVDVVHLPLPFPPAPANAGQVVTIHDMFPYEHPDWYPPSERWTYRRSVALAVRRARRLVVPSCYVGNRVASMLGVDPERIEVVPEGVSGTFLHSLSEGEVQAVCARFGVAPGGFAVSVGAISIRKNQLALVQASRRLRKDGFAVVLVGSDGRGAEGIRTELARQDPREQVIQVGYLGEKDMAALVRAAAVVVHPSLAEGFGLVPLEAMAAGTPVIAARTTSIPEVVGDAGLLVDDPGDPSAWSAALNELLESPVRRSALAAAGKRQAAKFSWDRAARQILEVYRAAAGLT